MTIVNGILALGLALLPAVPARAENSGAADPALLLGTIKTFGAEDAARLACGRNAVVWADRYEGFAYGPSEPKYGKTATGSYACQQDAAAGNYWDTDPRSSMAGHPGRSFPFTPVFVGS
jgi:hypothetical protein